jgi:DNA repair protein RadC
MSDADRLIADSLAALESKMRRDGLPVFHDHRMAIVDAALRLHDAEDERLLLYLLDSQHRLLGVEVVAIGSQDTVSFSRALIARRALRGNAAAIIIVHNHPSAEPTPSQQDADAADRIDCQLAALDILVLGHFCVTADGYGDIRTRVVTMFKELIDPETPPPSGPRCPHCNGPLETTT